MASAQSVFCPTLNHPLFPTHNARNAYNTSPQVKEFRYDMFSPQSGQVIGRFLPDAPLPYEPHKATYDARLQRMRRQVPTGLTRTRDESACLYRAELLQDKYGEDLPLPGSVSVVWKCPGPDQGHALVVANVRRKNEQKWLKLTWSLKESLIRIFSKENEKEEANARKKLNKTQAGLGADAMAFKTDPAAKFAGFDQERQHTLFWGYIRDKQFDAAEAFLEKKSVMYFGTEKFRRSWRILAVLRSCFEETTGALVTTPFIYKPGVTRSKFVCQEMVGGTVAITTPDMLPKRPQVRMCASHGVMSTFLSSESRASLVPPSPNRAR